MFRNAQQAKAAELPALPVRLKACGLLNGQPYARPYDIVQGYWRLVAFNRDEDLTEETGIDGETSKGCVTLPDHLPEKLRAKLAKGSIFGVTFAGMTLPLKMVVEKKEIVLVFHPLDAPIPDH